MAVYGFNSQEDFDTARQVIRANLASITDRRVTQRGRFPLSDNQPKSPTAYIITQQTGSNENLAIYGPTTPLTVTCKKADGATDATATDSDVLIKPSVTCGVTFTGCMCWAFRVGTDRHMSSAESGHVFNGTATEAISPGTSGTVSLSYVDHFGANQTADVTAINDFIGLTAQSGSSVVVQFLFGPSVVDGTSRFRISEIGCP